MKISQWVLNIIVTGLVLLCGMPLAAQTAKPVQWQQNVATKIDVTLDDVNNFLRAHIAMDYTNNSPDTLQFIYFHLYPNAYKNNQTAFAKQFLRDKNLKFYNSDEADKGWIDSLDFKANNIAASIIATENIDVIKLQLPTPIYPGATVKITTPFKVKIPKVFSRLGHGDQSYQISQWFPKPAVYDHNGWHAFPYLNYGEFFSEYGTYDVSITLPENYIVMATGNLMNDEEHLRLAQLSKETNQQAKERNLVATNNTKTLRFVEDNIHDFAWFANKHWQVKIDTITSSASVQPIVVYSAFLPEDYAVWQHSLLYAKQAIEGFSKYVGAYPYQTVKIAEGALKAGGGMEYPTVTVIDAVADKATLQKVIVHEVGHNWFYGILGSNERTYPWMDEGFTSYYEQIICKENPISINSNIVDIDRISNALMGAINNQHLSQPICSHSADLSEQNYGMDIYFRAPEMINYLAAYMGKTQFQQAIHNYFNEWKFKHPYPEDLQQVLQTASDKDINWFFNTAITANLNPNFSVQQKIADKEILVKNKHGMKVPVQLFTINGKDTLFSNWKLSNGKEDTLFFDQAINTKQAINLNPAIPDTRYSDNSSHKPFKLGGFFGYNDKPGYKAWIAPALGYNLYDGFMLGGLLHNLSVPSSRLQFAIAPLFGFKSQKLSGTGFINYDTYFQNASINKISFRLQGKSFEQFTNPNYNYGGLRFYKFAPSILFSFAKPYFTSPVDRILRISAYGIGTQKYKGHLIIDSNYVPTNPTYDPLDVFVTLQYQHKNTNVLQPFSYMIDAQIFQEFIKIGLTGNVKFLYGKKNKGVNLRGFAGKFIQLNNNVSSNYFLTMNHGGVNDYLYDETYMGRTERANFWANQSSQQEGGFYSNTALYVNPVGLSDNWLFATNVSIDLPVSPLKVFGNFAYSLPTDAMSQMYQQSLQYEIGLELKLSDYFSIASPFIVSQDIRDYRKFILGKNIFWQTLSFRINLSKLQYENLATSALNL